MKYFLITVWGDVEPQKSGPYADEAERDEAAKKLRIDDTNHENGIYKLDIDEQDSNWDSAVAVDSYSGVFFEEDEKDDYRYSNHYDCSECGHEWSDTWSCACNDKCPGCGSETEPSESLEKCSACDGTGYVGNNDQKCDDCNGKGYLS